MARKNVNPIHKIMAFMGWLVLLAVLGYGGYTGYGYYQVYQKGYRAGENAGRAFQREARTEGWKFNWYYHELHSTEVRSMPLKHGKTWKDAIYRNGWDSGLTRVAGHAPRY